MNMARKVLNISLDGCNIECIRTDDKVNPFRVYKRSLRHRRQIAKYADFISVIYFLMDFYKDGVDSMTFPEVVGWARNRGSI
jgi:hypothetical protein